MGSSRFGIVIGQRCLPIYVPRIQSKPLLSDVQRAVQSLEPFAAALIARREQRTAKTTLSPPIGDPLQFLFPDFVLLAHVHGNQLKNVALQAFFERSGRQV